MWRYSSFTIEVAVLLCVPLGCGQREESNGQRKEAKIDIQECRKLLEEARKSSRVVFDRYLLKELGPRFSIKELEASITDFPISPTMEMIQFQRLFWNDPSSVRHLDAKELKRLKAENRKRRKPALTHAEAEYRRLLETCGSLGLKRTRQMLWLAEDCLHLGGGVGSVPPVAEKALSWHLGRNPISFRDIARVELAICLLKQDRREDGLALLREVVEGFEGKETRSADIGIRNSIPLIASFTRPDEVAMFILAVEALDCKEYEKALRLCQVLQRSVPNSLAGFLATDVEAEALMGRGDAVGARQVMRARIERIQKPFVAFMGAYVEYSKEGMQRIIESLEKYAAKYSGSQIR